MTDLLYAGGDNPGGLFSIRFVPVVGVQSLPLPAAGTVASPPTFRTGYGWLKAYGTVFTADFDEADTVTDNGHTYSISLELFLPGDSAQRRAQLSTMTAHRFIVEFDDNTGLVRRVGTIVESLQLTTKFSSGKQLADKRGHTLTFSGVLTSPAPIVTV